MDINYYQSMLVEKLQDLGGFADETSLLTSLGWQAHFYEDVKRHAFECGVLLPTGTSSIKLSNGIWPPEFSMSAVDSCGNTTFHTVSEDFDLVYGLFGPMMTGDSRNFRVSISSNWEHWPGWVPRTIEYYEGVLMECCDNSGLEVEVGRLSKPEKLGVGDDFTWRLTVVSFE